LAGQSILAQLSEAASVTAWSSLSHTRDAAIVPPFLPIVERSR
jgi:hypothetical protein